MTLEKFVYALNCGFSIKPKRVSQLYTPPRFDDEDGWAQIMARSIREEIDSQIMGDLTKIAAEEKPLLYDAYGRQIYKDAAPILDRAQQRVIIDRYALDQGGNVVELERPDGVPSDAVRADSEGFERWVWQGNGA